ncbi:DsbA family protein [Nocardia altamirensis]|uniref:DsbA family protein n=1 Tax=Nocardia altamirensis TaxID=472158 RepID=UPI001FE1DB6F|nr:thioredoxin domain-containing protein [Nocardia altamirensis]
MSPEPQHDDDRDSHNRRVLYAMVAGALLFVVVAVTCVGIVANDLSKDFIGTAVAAGPPGQDSRTLPVKPAPPVGQISLTVPAGVTDNGAVRVGEPSARAVVRVVADLQCPACQAFEKANAKALEEATKNGTAVVEYNIISFLDRASTTQYSSRANNASYCVAESDSSKYQSWLASMFEQQPAEGGDGLPDRKLIEIAEAAGYTDPAVAQCITERKYDAYVRSNTKDILATGINSTPSVFINGKQIEQGTQLFTTDGLAGPIAAAAR